MVDCEEGATFRCVNAKMCNNKTIKIENDAQEFEFRRTSERSWKPALELVAVQCPEHALMIGVYAVCFVLTYP